MWEALDAQENIGWIHLFCGKLSWKWLLLYDSQTPPDQRGIFNESYLWGAAIIETILWQYIELWELRNKEVHNDTSGDDEFIKNYYANEVKRLHTFRNQVRPGDKFLFVKDLKSFLKKSTSKMLAQYILSHRKVIYHSMEQWKKSKVKTPSVLDWLVSSNPVNKEVVEYLHEKQRRDFNDGRQKEKRRKYRKKKYKIQSSKITSYMSYT